MGCPLTRGNLWKIKSMELPNEIEKDNSQPTQFDGNDMWFYIAKI